MAPNQYTEEQLAMLSPEERAAIADPEYDEEKLRAIAAAASGDDDEQDGKGDDGNNGDAVKKDAIAKAGDDKADKTDAGNKDVIGNKDNSDKDDKSDKQDAVTQPRSEFVQEFKVAPVENFDQRIAAFKAEKAALRTKFQDGDLDMNQYEEQKDAITDQETALREQKITADFAADQNKNNAEARWKWEQDSFFSRDANKIYKDDPKLMAQFDRVVRVLGNDPENDGKDFKFYLDEADRTVRAMAGITAAKPAENNQNNQQDDKKQVNRKPDLKLIPPGLNNMPAAEIAQTGDVDEFAHLDRLTGLELENALNRLSPAERERYRAAA